LKVNWTEISGINVFQTHKFVDDRGSLEVVYDQQMFKVQVPGKDLSFARILVVTSRKGTLRGIHKARKDLPEVKFVTCISGSVREVLVDLRPNSKTFKSHTEITLESEQGNAVLIPTGLGQAYEVLSDEATLLYALNTSYSPPDLNIHWGNFSYRSKKDSNSENLERLIQDGMI